jgi:hypothetical protein
MNIRTIPLTLCWYLMVWRGGSRFAAGPVRVYDAGERRTRTIGATLSLCRFTIGLACLGRVESLATRAHWYRDVGRFSVGGWRTSRCVPVSTGWITNGVEKAGVLITVASRTVYLVRMFRRGEYRDYRREWEPYGSGARPCSGRARKERHQ